MNDTTINTTILSDTRAEDIERVVDIARSTKEFGRVPFTELTEEQLEILSRRAGVSPTVSGTEMAASLDPLGR